MCPCLDAFVVWEEVLAPTIKDAPSLRNPADFSILLQALDDVKKRQDEIYVTLNSLQTM